MQKKVIGAVLIVLSIGLIVFIGYLYVLGARIHEEERVQNEEKRMNEGVEAQAFIVDTNVLNVPDDKTIPMYGADEDSESTEERGYTVRLYALKEDYYVTVTEKVLDSLQYVEYLPVTIYKGKVAIATKQEVGMGEDEEAAVYAGDEQGIEAEAVVLGKQEIRRPKQQPRYEVKLYVLKEDYEIRVPFEVYRSLEITDKVPVRVNKDVVTISDTYKMKADSHQVNDR